MEYFELLVQHNQSKSPEEKAHYQAQLARFHGSRARVLHEGQARFYARWYYGVVWHYFGLRQDENNPARIAKRIYPPITTAQAEEAIGVLLELKLIRKLANGYAVSDRHLAAGKGLRGAAAREHHRDFLRLAMAGIDAAPAGERRSSVTTFSISARGRERVMERVDALRAEVRELAESDARAAEGSRVYALTLQLFPCSLEAVAALPEIRPEPHGVKSGAGTSSDSGNSTE
jgi:uncharacterized protein (TIGR02147 family)